MAIVTIRAKAGDQGMAQLLVSLDTKHQRSNVIIRAKAGDQGVAQLLVTLDT